MKRVIVVGASSGIGAELARQLCAGGWHVVAVARRQAELEALAASITGGRGGRVDVLAHDVTRIDEVAPAFVRAVELLGGVDALVYNAGVLPVTELDEFDTAKDANTLAVNLVGAVAWCNEAARLLQAAGAGQIVGVGSVAGDRGRIGAPVYNASKAGFETYLEALRNRLDRRGVRVVTIKPGPVRTPMIAGRGPQPMEIEAWTCAAAIVRAMEGGPLVVYVPWQWRPIMAVIRMVPSVIFRKLNV